MAAAPFRAPDTLAGAMGEAALTALLRRLLPEGVAVAVARPGAQGLAALDAELAALGRAVPKRRRDFIAGRAAAQRAMAALGAPGLPLLPGPDRAPAWPAGLIGSLSHSGRFSLAAVARREALAGIGLDAVEDLPAAADAGGAGCTPAERAWLDAQPRAVSGRMRRLILSAKESLCKALSPLCGQPLDGAAVEIAVATEAGAFTARLTRPAGPIAAGAEIAGRFGRAAATLVTVVALPAGPNPERPR